jgi:GxxExxY protein
LSDEGQFLSFIKPSNLIVASVRTLSSTADIVELKCKDAFHPVDEAQLLSHLRLLNIPLGLLINFHVVLLKDGIKRMVNYYDENLGQPESDALNRKGR